MRPFIFLSLFALACPRTQIPDAASLQAAAVDEAALDRSVAPCDDFYQFACGGWMAKNPVPPDRARWVRSFSEIDKRNEERVRGLIEAAAAGRVKDPDGGKLGDLYAVCLDEAKAETESPRALQAALARVAAVSDAKDLAREVAAFHRDGAPAFFDFDSGQDFKDATQVIGIADQGGMGLPDRDYYLAQDEKKAAIRKQYVEHAGKLLALAGSANAGAEAQTVMRIETALAKGALDRTARRNPANIYHRIERAGLAKTAPRFDWDGYFAALGYPDVRAINVAVPAFFTAFDEVVAATPIEDLRTYLRWTVIRLAAPMLGKSFVEERFRFVSQAFTGSKEDLPRWKKCVAFATGAMGQSVGRLFVEGVFGEEGKAASVEMIRAIEDAFEKNLGSLAWMDEATRAQAKEKLHRIANQIAFPNKWRDYSSLEVDRGSWLANATRAARFDAQRRLEKIGKPLDREDWEWPPSIVNAQYDPSLNRMQFPAGILQPPFFSRDAAPAENYGGIGFVMGHELVHGFDDEGRQYDGAGNLRDWWTQASGKAYEERAQCVADQYSGYTVLDGQHVNGKLTLGENIADVAGVKMAYRALLARRGDRPPEKPVGGFSEEQRFFLAAAQVWCSNEREQLTRMRLVTDPHSPPRYRVIGPLSNSPDFAAAFQCKPGSRMAPEKRCEVW